MSDHTRDAAQGETYARACAQLTRDRDELLTALDVAEDVLRECSKALNSSKVWGGMSYNYSPIHPINYNKARDAVNEYWNQKQAALLAKHATGSKP